MLGQIAMYHVALDGKTEQEYTAWRIIGKKILQLTLTLTIVSATILVKVCTLD